MFGHQSSMVKLSLPSPIESPVIDQTLLLLTNDWPEMDDSRCASNCPPTPHSHAVPGQAPGLLDTLFSHSMYSLLRARLWTKQDKQNQKCHPLTHSLPLDQTTRFISQWWAFIIGWRSQWWWPQDKAIANQRFSEHGSEGKDLSLPKWTDWMVLASIFHVDGCSKQSLWLMNFSLKKTKFLRLWWILVVLCEHFGLDQVDVCAICARECIL